MIKLYWSRVPGKFVNMRTGDPINVEVNGAPVGVGPKFEGSVREWYETLVETIIDASNQMSSPAQVVYVGSVIRTILECSVLFRSKLPVEGEPTNVLGRLSDRFEIQLDDSLANDIRLESGNDTAIVSVLDINII